jgi:hypothetical protein
MGTRAIFPSTPARAGMYESFYLRSVSPAEPLGVWIRHTVHKRPGAPPRGSVWFTLFDPSRGEPLMHKLTRGQLAVPAGGWIAVGSDARLGPGVAEGSCGPASWSLEWSELDPPLRHLPALLYRLPVPRTKLTSPAPAARFRGSLRIEGRETIELDAWPGMVGHNWGSEHAERWIWLHAVGLEGEPDAWLDVALGRVLVAGRLTPWLANGALSLDGVRRRLGGVRARARVDEGPRRCELVLGGADGLTLTARVSVPDRGLAGWRYADPDGGEHDVLNCSVAALELELAGKRAPRTLRCGHCAAYELGMRERDHGVALAPFPDG